MLKVSFLLVVRNGYQQPQEVTTAAGRADTGAAVNDKWVDPTAVSGSGCASADKLGFASASDVTFQNYAGIGHGVEFHRNGPTITQSVTDWLTARPNAMPTC